MIGALRDWLVFVIRVSARGRYVILSQGLSSDVVFKIGGSEVILDRENILPPFLIEKLDIKCCPYLIKKLYKGFWK